MIQHRVSRGNCLELFSWPTAVLCLCLDGGQKNSPVTRAEFFPCCREMARRGQSAYRHPKRVPVDILFLVIVVLELHAVAEPVTRAQCIVYTACRIDIELGVVFHTRLKDIAAP